MFWYHQTKLCGLGKGKQRSTWTWLKSISKSHIITVAKVNQEAGTERVPIWSNSTCSAFFLGPEIKLAPSDFTPFELSSGFNLKTCAWCVAITNLLAHPFSQFRFGRHTIPVFQLSKSLFVSKQIFKLLILNVCSIFVKWNQICKEVYCWKMQYLTFFSSFVDKYSNMNQIPIYRHRCDRTLQCLQFI